MDIGAIIPVPKQIYVSFTLIPHIFFKSLLINLELVPAFFSALLATRLNGFLPTYSPSNIYWTVSSNDGIITGHTEMIDTSFSYNFSTSLYIALTPARTSKGNLFMVCSCSICASVATSQCVVAPTHTLMP